MPALRGAEASGEGGLLRLLVVPQQKSDLGGGFCLFEEDAGPDEMENDKGHRRDDGRAM